MRGALPWPSGRAWSGWRSGCFQGSIHRLYHLSMPPGCFSGMGQGRTLDPLSFSSEACLLQPGAPASLPPTPIPLLAWAKHLLHKSSAGDMVHYKWV